MELCRWFPLVEDILDSFSGDLGPDLQRYRNHVYRDLNYFAALHASDRPVPETVQIAAAFHDIGIWTDGTLDYLNPSVAQAHRYLHRQGLESCAPEVETLILEHHKIRPYQGCHANVETFRKADQIDVSRGLLRLGIGRSLVHEAHLVFPTLGFHRLLAKLALRQFLRTPLRPLPMFRW